MSETELQHYCPNCKSLLPRPMISERTADARARMSLLEDFEAIVVVPRTKFDTARTLLTSFLVNGQFHDLKKMLEAVLHTSQLERRLKKGESDGP